MLNIGIVGAENSHTAAIAKVINVDKRVPGVRVTHVWGETRAYARKAAEAGEIPHIVKEPVDMVGDDPERWSHIRIATKYPTITQRHFAQRGVQAECIKLSGAMELAPNLANDTNSCASLSGDDRVTVGSPLLREVHRRFRYHCFVRVPGRYADPVTVFYPPHRIWYSGVYADWTESRCRTEERS